VKPTWFITIILFLIPAIHGCANKEEQAVEASKERGGDVASEEIAAIKRTVTDFAKAMTNFPRTRDKGQSSNLGPKTMLKLRMVKWTTLRGSTNIFRTSSNRSTSVTRSVYRTKSRI